MDMTVGLLLRDVVGVTFLLAGAAKRLDHARFLAALRELGFGPRSRSTLGRVLPPSEMVLGGGLVVGLIPVVTTTIAVVTIAAFAYTIVASIVRGRTADCGCFGNLLPSSTAKVSLVRGLALLVAAVAADIVAIGHPVGADGWHQLVIGLTAASVVTGYLLVVNLVALRLPGPRAVSP